MVESVFITPVDYVVYLSCQMKIVRRLAFGEAGGFAWRY
jgi:hypothetical protein